MYFIYHYVRPHDRGRPAFAGYIDLRTHFLSIATTYTIRRILKVWWVEPIALSIDSLSEWPEGMIRTVSGYRRLVSFSNTASQYHHGPSIF